MIPFIMFEDFVSWLIFTILELLTSTVYCTVGVFQLKTTLLGFGTAFFQRFPRVEAR